MDNISFKKGTISSYCAIPSMESLENNSISVVTAAGIILGTPIQNEESDENIQVFNTINDTLEKKYRDKYDLQDKQLPGSDGFFTLKNVKLITPGDTIKFNVLNIFYDQVIAITLGNIID